MSTNNTPTEDAEQIAFCDYLRLRGLPFYHPPAEMWTKSMNQLRRNKRMGATKGFPDLIIALPKKHRMICIEMKRTKGGVISDEQKEWHKTLNDCGIMTFVAYGCDEAIRILEEVEHYVGLDWTMQKADTINIQEKVHKLPKSRKNPEDVF